MQCILISSRFALPVCRLVVGDADEQPPVEAENSLPGRRAALDLNAFDVDGMRKPVMRKSGRHRAGSGEYVPSGGESDGSGCESDESGCGSQDGQDGDSGRPVRPTVAADARYRRFSKSIVKMGSYDLKTRPAMEPTLFHR